MLNNSFFSRDLYGFLSFQIKTVINYSILESDFCC